MNSKINEFIKTSNAATFIFSGLFERAKNSFARNFFSKTRISYFLKGVGSYLWKPQSLTLTFYHNIDVEIVSIGIHKLNQFKEIQPGKILVLGGVQEYNYCLKHRYNFIDISTIYRTVAFSEWSYENYSIDSKLEKLRARLIPVELDDFILFANNDFLPFYRAIIFILQERKCELHVFQHGFYNYKSINGQIEGEFANVNYILDDIQYRKLIETKRFSNSQMIIQKKEKGFNSSREISNQKIVIIGEGWHSQDRRLFYKYFCYTTSIIKILNRSRIEYIYRPHPTERFFFKFIPCKKDNLNLEDSLKFYNIFIGFTSSVLKEAKDKGCITIQIQDKSWDIFENFEKIGYANYTTNLKGLNLLLENILSEFKE